MLAIGRTNRLKIKAITAEGAYLESEEGVLLLPPTELHPSAKPGESIAVFIYTDPEGRPVATRLKPKAELGEFALLEVKEAGRYGAFLDWGLGKDLLSPFSEQPEEMRKGERHLVRVYLDKSGRIAASAKIGKFLEEENVSLRGGDEVELMIYEFTDLGAKVIINNRYTGLLFRDELYDKPPLGERLAGYVKKIRDDRKIDVTLRKSGCNDLMEARGKILKAVTENGGFLPLNDKSPPEVISEVLRMSKKTFKRTVGGLYKEGLIILSDAGITLRS
ncbi:MAG: S1-like domain-containing RNA-binding protein [Deltaproteobacteria bacterium]